ncbi:T6SS effector amidase Tae4 family protein [Sphingobacterium deserti]|uniref:Type VI secretion system (T6SS), amidase effector protein 4 n=1 Tax=Sphingobacterium deserti TaxID=1229276 RepID=A0A0B8SZT3_9SPHI|nr:T6SS effector amidase Tae4 family protein [Sphingobacterium deserti]KGE13166.1 hypothetical protein DI53_3002 [Sphingobacterium deserti]
MALFDRLWTNLPTNLVFPCDQVRYQNQCAIRMSVALQKSEISVRDCPAVKCDFHLSEHNTIKHFLRAQELANWFKQSGLFGKTNIYERATLNKLGTRAVFSNRKGIIFIEDGWGPTDHIDLWNGQFIKNGGSDYLEKGVRIWFWDVLQKGLPGLDHCLIPDR